MQLHFFAFSPPALLKFLFYYIEISTSAVNYEREINQFLLMEHQLVFFYWLSILNMSIVSLRSCSCK